MEKAGRLDKQIIDDITDELQDREDLLRLFRQLPKPLWKKHFEHINTIAAEHGGDDAAHQQQIVYLTGVLDSRREKSESLSVGDTPLRAHLAELQSRHALGGELESLLASHEKSLGKGQTARVRSLSLGAEQVAVKYLLTPSAKTLSANAEYDMLHEVETVTKIEHEQVLHEAGRRIRVPHPHFFYKNERLQCYAMQQVEGVTLAELMDPSTLMSTRQDDLRTAALQSLSEKYAAHEEREELESEMERFMSAVHEICLHGDIKMGNIMVNTSGDLFLIDFGQSVSMNLASDKTGDQFENLKVLEVDQFRECIHAVFNELRRPRSEFKDAA